jgi:1-aminocyclopropane-1-carboxylate deaminase
MNAIDELLKCLSIRAGSPLQKLDNLWPNSDKVEIWVKRDDLLHPIISGNKWRKLKYALVDIILQNPSRVISFGGGYSNHLHALAYACHKLNIHFTAIVRGDYSQNLTPMLKDIACWNAEICYVDRKTYQRRNDADYLALLASNSEDIVIIPEGGSQVSATKGVAEIVSELDQNFDYIIAPVGSGGTLAGLVSGASHLKTKILGIAVLKGPNYLEQQVQNLLPILTFSDHGEILHNYHFGGYAKSTEELKEFCQGFTEQANIRIEPVYSGKLFFAARDLVTRQIIPKGSRILLLHTGGLQGAR